MYIPRAPSLAPVFSLAECRRLWPTVAYRATPGVHKQFADRIMHQMARNEWTPGPAQFAFMRELVALYAPNSIALDPDLVEDMTERTGWTIER